MTKQGISPTGRIILLGSIFIVAACGLVYELVAGAVSSYLIGDAVTQFSLVIGVFLCAMGVGSYLAKYFSDNLLRVFVEIEILIAVVGGCSSTAMFAVSAFARPVFSVFFYSLCAATGILIGIEIPLLIRILKEDEEVSEALSHVLAIDYVGALAGSVLFPLFFLPYFGLSRASVVFGIMNLFVALFGLKLLERIPKATIVRFSIACIVLTLVFIFSTRLVGFLENILYQDNIVYAKSTRYQRVVVTKWRNDIRLFLNGHIQFSSIDEARYHESLVIPSMEAAPKPQEILILGGGDGLAAREVLKYSGVRRIVLVDIDPVVTELCRTRPEIVALNNNSLNSSKVEIINTDAMKFVEDSVDFFDVIIVDLPDPSTSAMAKLYSTSFYALCARRLKPDGVLVTQATSPFYAKKAFKCIEHTIEEALPPAHPLRFDAYPYHVNIPSFGEWGFVMASTQKITPDRLTPSVPTRFLNADTLSALFVFSKDLSADADIDANRLEHPVVYHYYKEGWKKFNN